MTQQALGDGIGCTQANIGHYERGQMLSPDMALRLIEFCAHHGLVITYDHVYGAKPLPDRCQFSGPTPGRVVLARARGLRQADSEIKAQALEVAHG